VSRLLSRLPRWVTALSHSKPDNPSRAQVPSGPALDWARQETLAMLRQCQTEARELLDPRQWNAHLEWILNRKDDPYSHGEGFDEKTVDGIVLELEDLADLVSSAPEERPGAPADDPQPDPRARQSVARGLRLATESFSVVFGSHRSRPEQSPHAIH